MVLILAGCEPDDCKPGERRSLLQQKQSLQAAIAKLPATGSFIPKPDGAAPAAAPTRSALKLTSGPLSPFPKVVTIPNGSTGKFRALVTVSVASLKGVTAGSSLAGFRYDQSNFQGSDSRTFYLGVSPVVSSAGFTAFAADFVGQPISTAKSFAGATSMDLQLEQTDAALIFSARPTPSPGMTPDAWTEVHRENTPPDPAPFFLGVGMTRTEKGASFYFTGLAIDGDAIGGVTEHAIIVKVRDAVEAAKDANAKLVSPTPDFVGALAALDASSAFAAEAYQMVKDGMVDYTLQRRSSGRYAFFTLKVLPEEYAAIRTPVAASDGKKTAAVLPRLRKLIEAEQGVMGNLLGWNAPPLGKLPEDLFSLRLPR